MAKVYGTPFIAGKDSLNNDYVDEDGTLLSIPGTLLISAIAVVADVRKTVSMYFKQPGNPVYVVGVTKNELGGSQYNKIYGVTEHGNVPVVNPHESKRIMTKLHGVMNRGLVKSCHDCSAGGLAVAISEMSFSGGFGIELSLNKVLAGLDKKSLSSNDIDTILLFSESNSRFLVEISPADKHKFGSAMEGTVMSCIGKVNTTQNLVIKSVTNKTIITENINKLKQSWQKALSKKL
jgi:phosphoribosylformylglycinamidine synthase